jgi:hypothetical protein
MSQEAPGTESITEDGGEQDSTPDRIEDMSDEQILAEGNKDDTLGTGESETEDASDTDVDSILPDDKDTEDAETEDKGEEEDETSDEDKEVEEDLEEELLSEEEQELDEFVKRETPEYNDIKKKYPKFFKEFPGMRHTLFRMKAMDRVFTSVDEAKQVAAKHDDLIQLEAAVVGGEADKVIRGLKSMDATAMEKFAEAVLPALFQEARPVHDRITGNVLSTALRVAQQQARSSGNKNLYNAVGHLSQFLFGKDAPPEASRRQTSPEIEAEKERLNNERQQMYDAKARDFQTDVVSTGERLLRKELARGLDPQNVLPDFVKESIVESAIQKIGAAMDKDEAHLGTINQLWARAQRAGFSKEAKAKLVAAWFGRAKAIAGPTRRKLVASAVEKASGKPQRDINRRRHVRTGGKGTSERQGFRPKSAREVDWSKTSDLDILTGKATARKR